MKALDLLNSNNDKCIVCGRILRTHRMSGSVPNKSCHQNDHYFNDTDNCLEINLDDYIISITLNELEILKNYESIYLEDISLKDDFESVDNIIDFMYKKVKVIADNLIFI